MFSHPASRRVSSEGSAEAVPQAVCEHRLERSLGEDLSVVGQAKAASESTPPEVIMSLHDMQHSCNRAKWRLEVPCSLAKEVGTTA